MMLKSIQPINMLINSLGGGGTERVCVRLANEFILKGYNVNIFVYKYTPESYLGELHENVKVYYLGIVSLKHNPLKLLKIKQNIQGNKLLVFNPQAAIAIEMFNILRMCDIEVILRINNTLSIAAGNKGKFHHFLIEPFMKIFFRRISKIICQSTGMYRDIKKNYHVKDNCLVIIGNPISLITASKAEVIESEKNEKYILYVGRLAPQKSIHYSIKSFVTVSKKFPSVKFLIIGEGECKASLTEQVLELGLEKKVLFLGHQADTISYYKNAELTILSSLYEGFPNVLLESIICGTPVVSFDCPSGPEDIIKNGVNGYLSSYLDEFDLAKNIELALEREWDRKEIKDTIDDYSSDKIANQYLHALEMK